jgi:hypothetical protein
MVKLWQSPAYLTYVQPELTDELVSKFEKFVIYTTRNHRGHLDQGMNLQINSYSIRVAIIITLLTINLLLFIRKESKIHPDKSEIDSDLI